MLKFLKKKAKTTTEEIVKINSITLSGFIEDSIVDGPGLRFVVFFQGCSRHCPNCHNKNTWSFDEGKSYLISDIVEKVKSFELLNGVTISGGEPLDNQEALLEFLLELRKVLTRHQNIMIYTGYEYQDLLDQIRLEPDCLVGKILANTDILKCGPYVENLKTLDIPFLGSSNQQLIYLNPERE
jgi:anaerobic ribonucleoside-triphosphate reductase activating protein